MEFTDDIFETLQEKSVKGEGMKTEPGVKNPTKDPSLRKLEKAIIPRNPNTGRSRGIKVAKTLIPAQPSDKVQAYSYSGDVDPFSDARSFMFYFRAFLQQSVSQRIQFNAYEVDAPFAARILDILQEKNRSNRAFLNGWLKYFATYRLKGQKFEKTQYTSLRVFEETFDEYNKRHIEV
jgi:hypothetical protein